MKKIAALIAAATLATTAVTAQAATYKILEGSKISGWEAVNGIGGGAYQSFFGDLVINLEGTIKTGQGFNILEIEMSQVGSASGTSALGGVMTVSGLSWEYGSNANNQATSVTSDFALLQVGNATASCGGANPTAIDCTSTANGIVNGGANSAMNFDGIGAGELYMNAAYAPVAEGPKGGATFLTVVPWGLPAGTDVILKYTLNAFTDAGGLLFNANNRMVLELHLAEVPVPAAAWLLGSGLVGLAGIARRRKMA